MTLEEKLEIEREEGIEKGKAIGHEQGLAEGKLEVAKKMLEENMSKEIISKLTSISLREIEDIAKSLNK